MAVMSDASASDSADTVRPATARDVAAVRQLVEAAYLHYVDRIGVRPAPMDSDHAAQVAAGRVFVTGDPPTGAIALVPRPDHLFVESVAVHPGSQGTGLGRRLMAFAETRARALGLPEIRLYTHAMMWENQRFYPALGYEVVERRLDQGYDRIFYRKPVNRVSAD
jgi:ribosomal protein S18 acetylase RimI-like enzyme